MRNRTGSMVLVMILIASAMILVGIIAYQYMRPSNGLVQDYSQKGTDSTVQELTQTDEVSDIEKDLNLTNTETIDADIVGVTSLVE